MELAFQLLILLFSVVIHEVAHGFAASAFGDDTARNLGRLTLNPLKHLDVFGSFILPASLFFVSGGAFVFGFAKPVPFNPGLLKNPKKESGLIALAGPLSNLIIATIIGLIVKTGDFLQIPIITNTMPLLYTIAVINVSLAIFNLVPIPPLDGSKILFALIPQSFQKIEFFLEKYGIFILFAFIMFGFQLLSPIISIVLNLIV